MLELSAPEGLHPEEETAPEQFVINYSLWEGPALEEGNRVRSPFPGKEAEAETL